MAERQGFEPWRPLSRPTHFPGAPVQPLRHLSLKNAVKSMFSGRNNQGAKIVPVNSGRAEGFSGK